MTNKSLSPKLNFLNINKKNFNSGIETYINFENNLTKNYKKIIDNKHKYLFSEKTERKINESYKRARIKKIINYKYKYEKWIN